MHCDHSRLGGRGEESVTCRGEGGKGEKWVKNEKKMKKKWKKNEKKMKKNEKKNTRIF